MQFLRSADSFPGESAPVETIETHFAWIFLTRRFAYKLKKPLRFRRVDLRDINARKTSCELEDTLNRRLAEAVYIGVVPLTLRRRRLYLEDHGEPVDWLVKMHRLRHDRMLDAAARAGTVQKADLEAVLGKLAGFYRHTSRAQWNGSDYVHHLIRQIHETRAQLTEPGLGLDINSIDVIVARQSDFVQREAACLEDRADQQHVVDAHGDLKPEHVFLDKNPQIIDCLEFSTELRWLDTAEEISFLALECERLGHADVAAEILALYRDATDDSVPARLLDFYRSQRALARAMLSAWRLAEMEADPAAPAWLERTRWYLDIAAKSMARALS